MRVHITRPVSDTLAGLLRSGIELTDNPPYDVLVDGVPEAPLADGCRAVVIPYAGVPRKTRELVASLDGVALYNLHHNAIPTAEMAMALLLAAARRIVPMDRGLRTGDWRERYGEERDVLLHGKTAVILGHGSIGRHVADACRAFGMHVETVRRGNAAALPELLPRAHALMICVPWTDQTEGMIGAAELALLPDGALLVNIARGPVVDEAALYNALKSGRIAAGLDVWYEYPKSEEERTHTMPATQPFHELVNVVMSPHHGGLTDGVEEMRAQHLADVLNALARGEDAPGRVDLTAGY